MNNNKAIHNVSSDVSRNDNMFQNAMLKAVGMRKTAAWIPAEKAEQKSNNRKDRYRRKLAVNGIRQLNIQVPDSDLARGTFNKLASAVRNDEINTEKLALLIKEPEKADMAVELIIAIQADTIRGRLLKTILKYLIR